MKKVTFQFFISLIIIFFFTTCGKDAASVPEENAGTSHQFSFATSDWIAYPYIGGVGEDSMLFLRLHLPASMPLKHSQIEKVYFKSPAEITIEKYTGYQTSGRFSYQLNSPNQSPVEILLWWQQTTPLARPSLDSVFVQAKY